MKITKCTGEGQGSCKRCSENGKWNRAWMCFLYHIEGYEGCYCWNCVKKIKNDVEKMNADILKNKFIKMTKQENAFSDRNEEM